MGESSQSGVASTAAAVWAYIPPPYYGGSSVEDNMGWSGWEKFGNLTTYEYQQTKY